MADDIKVITKIALAIVDDDKILMTKATNSGEAYYFPGGALEIGESELECLKREIKEELDASVDEESLEYLGEFEDWAHGKKNTRVKIRLWTGKLLDKPVPSMEITELIWCDTNMGDKHHSMISKNHIFPFLKERGLIK